MIAFNMKIFVNIAEIRVERINKIPTVVGYCYNFFFRIVERINKIPTVVGYNRKLSFEHVERINKIPTVVG